MARAQAPLRERVDRLARPYLESDVVVGMTIGVLQDGRRRAFGYGRVSKEDGQRPDGDTIYEIGSLTKVFTGVLLADAVVADRVRLEQPAGELLPAGVAMPTRPERAITLKDLATHVSALPRLPDNIEFTDPSNPYAGYTVARLHEFLAGHTLRRAPGERGEYSNLAAGLLGHLLSLRQERSYEQLLRERIAKPLGMRNTTITLSDEQRSRLAAPHRADGQGAANWDMPALAGAGAVRSSVNDMLRFAAANLERPAGALGQALELAWTIHQPPIEGNDFAMGLGWHVARDGQTRWHNGGTGGYHSMMLVNREMGLAVVLLANTATGEVDHLAEDVIRMLAGAPVEPRVLEKAVEVSPEVMRRYVGKYELVPGLVFTVSVDDGKLMVGLTGQPTFQVHARSEREWFYKVVKATITFEVDDQGECVALELLQNGVRQRAKRVE